MGGRASRRAVLASAGAAAVAGSVGLVGLDQGLPGRSWLLRTLGLDGRAGTVPEVAPGRRTDGSFFSRARGTPVGWSIARPPRAEGRLPVVVVLHGRGGDHTTAFARSYLGLDRFLAAAVADGVPPFALASVDGGETYWHDRADGDRCETMLREELLPLLARHDLDTERIGLLGWSMGGFGALHLAQRLGSAQVAGVAVMSPALWDAFEDTAPGAFDSGSDFARATVVGRQAALSGIAVRVDCGESDPFFPVTRTYVEGFGHRPAGAFTLGGHDLDYWRRTAPHGLRHLGEALHA